MALTERQLERRIGRVTASNVAAILGMDRYKSPRAAFMEITGRSTFQGNEATKWGEKFEPAILELFTERTGIRVKKRNVERRAPGLELWATLDADLDGVPAHAEVKTFALKGFRDTSEWGEDGTDEVPDRTFIQAQAQLVCAPEHECVYVPAFLGPLGFRVYQIFRHAEMQELIRERVPRFIRDHLEPDIAPAPDYRDVDSFKSYHSEQGKTAPVPADLVEEYLRAKADEEEASQRKDTARAAILKILHDAQADVGDCPGFSVTYRKCKDGQKFDLETFRTANPDLYARYLIPKPGHRTLRIAEAADTKAAAKRGGAA